MLRQPRAILLLSVVDSPADLPCGLLGLPAAAQAPRAPEGEAPPLSFDGEIDVALSSDGGAGGRRLGRTDSRAWRPDDYRMRAGKEEDLRGRRSTRSGAERRRGRPRPPKTGEPDGLWRLDEEAADGRRQRPGRLVVIFVQADLGPSPDQRPVPAAALRPRAAREARPRGPVAVVSSVRVSSCGRISPATATPPGNRGRGDARGEPPEAEPSSTGSLACHFDFAAAPQAASTERPWRSRPGRSSRSPARR